MTNKLEIKLLSDNGTKPTRNNLDSLAQYDGAVMDVEDGGLIYPVYGIDDKLKYLSGEIDTPVYKTGYA
ncbi:hypothetical protein [Staphylococcus phage vB_SsapH-Golestan-100]|nr:hypothetical protein [Staphylococcus phage vB_SsapH-Golestan-100]